MPMTMLMSPQEAADQLCVSRPMIYGLMKAGELESIKIGRARRIVTASLDDYIARQLASQASPAA